eukprot:6308687-Pyramimonas_sp.AAC.2
MAAPVSVSVCSSVVAHRCCGNSHVLGTGARRAPLDVGSLSAGRKYYLHRSFGRRTLEPSHTTTTSATTGSVGGFVSSLEEAAAQFTKLVGELGVVGDDK